MLLNTSKNIEVKILKIDGIMAEMSFSPLFFKKY